jgi:Bacterial signalling protein N terminal repeat
MCLASSLNQGPFEIHWNKGIVAASIIDAVVVALAGFWILFRLLLWKVLHYYC